MTKKFINFIILLILMYYLFRPEIDKAVIEAYRAAKRSHWTEWLGM